MNSSLSITDLASMAPLLIFLFSTLSLMMIDCFPTKSTLRWIFVFPIAIQILAAVVTLYAPLSENPLLTRWIAFDPLARFFTLLFICIGIGCSLLAISLFQNPEISSSNIGRGEYFILLLCAIAGLIMIGSAADFLVLFAGIEILSIALYALCGYIKNAGYSYESSMKYFLMGALATAFFLYGVALIYGATGTTSFAALLPAYQKLASPSDLALFTCGIAFVTAALAFKAALVPFQAWAPDVYAAAPTSVVAFMAIGTKIGAFAAFIRIFLFYMPEFSPLWNGAMSVIAYATLIYANFVALRQKELRRFFAYSGISHAGFLLIPLVVGTAGAIPSALFYLSMYALATFVAFAIIATIDKPSQPLLMTDLSGLFYRSPLNASLLTLSLLTLAGIPPSVGFFAKFYIFKEAFSAGYIGLVIVGSLMSVLAAFYYLRIIALMATSEQTAQQLMPLLLSPTARFVSVFSAAGIIMLSLFPAPLLSLLNNLTMALP